MHGVRGAAPERNPRALQPLRAVRHVRQHHQGVSLLSDPGTTPPVGAPLTDPRQAITLY